MRRDCGPGYVFLPTLGINLSKKGFLLVNGEAQQTQNMYYRSDLRKRYGFVRHSPNAIVAGSEVMALHRFLYGTNKVLIGVADTVARKLDEGTGLWADIITGLTANLPTSIYTWGGLNKMYLANGVDQKQYDGTASAAIPSAPSNALVILPYRSRLLSIDADGFIRWSIPDYAEPTGWTTLVQSLRLTGPGQTTTMVPHSHASPEKSSDSQVLVVKPNNMALLSGFDFTITATPDFQVTIKLDDLPVGIGSSSRDSFANVGIGTAFLGTDKQVYILPFGKKDFLRVGDKIRSKISGINGIESISDIRLDKVSGVFHDGFYKLSIPTTGATAVYQFWLDMTRFGQDREGFYGPWYGPMTGQSFPRFLTYPDGETLLAASYDGYVNRLSDPIFSDNGTAIKCRFVSKNQAFSGLGRDSQIFETEFIMNDLLTLVNMYLNDVHKPIGNIIQIPPQSVGNFMDEGYMDEVYLEGSLDSRYHVDHYKKSLIGRAISTTLDHTSATEDFRIGFIQHVIKKHRQLMPTNLEG